jgi:hypothetical protein
MGRVKDISIVIDEYFRTRQKEFDRLETLSEEDFKKDPEAVAAAKTVGIDVEFLSSAFMHNVE